VSTKPLWETYKDRIEALSDAKLNFDLERRHEYTEANGWHIDEYEADLPPEPPGPPIPNGPWRAAQQIMREYRFPDPGIITGIYFPDRALEERVMLLRGKFLFFSFFFGVKIGGVTNEVQETPDGPAHVWGFNYQTLEGHFERGQMTFETVKWEQSGRVVFRIHAFSQRAEIPNPIYRLGFMLFGRRLQRRFARRSLKRMQRLVQEQLAADIKREPVPASGATPVQPVSAEPGAQQKLQEVKEQVHQENSH
jgi:uncharacterized protein (UPF0548 family)